MRIAVTGAPGQLGGVATDRTISRGDLASDGRDLHTLIGHGTQTLADLLAVLPRPQQTAANEKESEIMRLGNGQRPPVWVGHVYLSVPDVRSAAMWLETVGVRPIVVRDEAAVLELRGGTHIVVRPGPMAGGTAPFDLMVDDIDAAHRTYGEKSLSPWPIHRGSAQARFEHDSFELPGPGGSVFTVYSSHVGDRPV